MKQNVSRVLQDTCVTIQALQTIQILLAKQGITAVEVANHPYHARVVQECRICLQPVYQTVRLVLVDITALIRLCPVCLIFMDGHVLLAYNVLKDQSIQPYVRKVIIVQN